MSKLKRLAAPEFWKIEKKTKKYAVAPSPGPHSRVRCIPLGIVLRDVLKAAETMREVREILLKGLVKINGKKRVRENFPVGLMDVVSVGDQNYRVLVSRRGMYLQPVEGKEASIRLCRVENKKSVSGKTQLSFHDGTNRVADLKCSTGDVLVFSVPDMAVKETLRLEKNSTVLVTAGNNSGDIGKLQEIIVTRSHQPNQAVVALASRTISIPKDFVFVIGKEKPMISTGERI